MLQKMKEFFLFVIDETNYDLYYEDENEDDEEEDTSTRFQIECNSPAAMRIELSGNGTQSYVFQATDQYTFRLYQCDPSTYVYAKVSISILNPTVDGELQQQLPIQLAMSPYVYISATTGYIVITGIWLWQCYTNKPNVLIFHIVCLFASISMIISSMIQSAYYLKLSELGEVSKAFNIFVYISMSISTTLFLGVTLSISFGWSQLQHTVTNKERWIMILLMTVYIIVSFARSFCYDNTEGTCAVLLLAEYIVKSFVLLASIVAMNYNIGLMRITLSQTPWSPIVPLHLQMIHSFEIFRWTFLGYILIPTVVLLIKMFVLSWEYEWTEQLLSEFFLFVVYIIIGYLYAPFSYFTLTNIFDFHNRNDQTRIPIS